MSGTVYQVQNAAYPTTAAPVKVATGTAIKTLLQIGIPSTVSLRVIEWGISFDTPASASIIACELFACTGAVSGGTSITPVEYGSLSGVASLCVGGATATCFSPTGEGTVAAYRPFDLQLITPPAQYVHQWPLGREPMTNVSTFVRVRVTASVTCNAYAWILWEE
jgi:hypothetical protein